MINKEVYLITNEPELIKQVRGALEPPGYLVIPLEDIELYSLIPERQQSALIVDFSIPDCLKIMKNLTHNSLIFIISDKKDKGKAIDAIRMGAYGYIEKPLYKEELLAIIERILGSPEMDDMWISSKVTKMKKVLRDLDIYAEDNLPVLIIGEDGINLEYYARLIHVKSKKNNKLFLPFRTFAEGEKISYWMRCLREGLKTLEGSSVFLNDICEIDKEILKEIVFLSMEKRIWLLGGTIHHIDETSEWTEEIKRLFEKRQIVIPPLRERREDIPQIVETLLKNMERIYRMGRKSLSRDTQKYFLRYTWPGNEREIEETIRKAYILAEGEIIGKKDIFTGNMRFCPLEEFLSLRLKGLLKENSGLYPAVVGEVEKALISIVLQEVEGNQLRASRILGINRNTLRSKIKEHGLNRLLTK